MVEMTVEPVACELLAPPIGTAANMFVSGASAEPGLSIIIIPAVTIAATSCFVVTDLGTAVEIVSEVLGDVLERRCNCLTNATW
jgi:hypothetical protein